MPSQHSPWPVLSSQIPIALILQPESDIQFSPAPKNTLLFLSSSQPVSCKATVMLTVLLCVSLTITVYLKTSMHP